LASPDAPPPRDVSPLRRGWTPARYLAPEARLGQWSAAVDEWGLGVTAWELLTGQHPYESNDDAAMMTLANRTHDPEVLAQLRRVIGVLRRSVDLDAARRWGSAARLCSALVATRAEGGLHDFDHAPSASRQPGPPPPYSPASHPTALAQPQTRATTPRPRGNRTAIAMFLVALWIAVFAGVVWYLASPPHPRGETVEGR
jgi:serine/threonine protein kinase